MITFSNTIVIDAEINSVFAFASKPENFPLWNYYIVSVQQVAGEGALGSRFHQRRKNDEQYFEITKYEPNQLVEYTTVP